ncbi:hypothetical protein NDU88_002951 [Pleurodeles waltl]|uniref:Uncharacterized protein n=1 Tax=Pleurodeles waltl TaxID=8319 RepID=A0AAV7TP47_PLEWA|nr:hypothetical protein NDU88_002951 [Pleurodeles waltl]
MEAVSRRLSLPELHRDSVGHTRRPGRETVSAREGEQPARLEPQAGIKILPAPPRQSTYANWREERRFTLQQRWVHPPRARVRRPSPHTGSLVGPYRGTPCDAGHRR